MAKKKPTLEELNEQIAAKENRLRDLQSWSVRWNYGEGEVRSAIQRLKDKRDTLYPMPLPVISVRLRVWRGQRSVREVVPMLATALGCEVSITKFCRIEGGHLENVEAGLLDKIEAFLSQG